MIHGAQWANELHMEYNSPWNYITNHHKALKYGTDLINIDLLETFYIFTFFFLFKDYLTRFSKTPFIVLLDGWTGP